MAKQRWRASTRGDASGWRSATLALSLALCGPLPCCTPAPKSFPPSAEGFHDHTQSKIPTLGDFESLSAEARGIREVKFLVTGFGPDERRELRFLDGRFYQFHDEWYWLHLLSGHTPPGDTVKGDRDYGFQTPQEAAAWALEKVQQGDALPLDLRFVEDRLYADRFYDIALYRSPQRYGLGSVFRLAQGDAKSTWAFKLEYADNIHEAELAMYFRLLEEALPEEISSRLVFVARSPQHHKTVERLKKQGHPLARRLKKYSDLVLPGQVEVYNPGLTAGRVRIIEEGETIPAVDTSQDILVLPALPDELPQAAGLITAVPQTPLAHVNLLAKNRGIPNLHLGGALKDVRLLQAAWDEMPAVLEARDNKFTLRPLDQKTYALWKRLTQADSKTIDEPDPAQLEYVYPLVANDRKRVDALRREVGGKAAGYVMLLAGSATTPGPALALSVRSFHEHLDRLQRWVRPTLSHPRFQNSPNLRYLVLEGETAFRKRFPQTADDLLRAPTLALLPPEMNELVKRGGLRKAIRTLPLDPASREHILAEVRQHFSHLDRTQGLRFRSSSNVEDLEGFNGAGLYTSSTGFLEASNLSHPKDKKRNIEAAIKKTWASFYSFEAFEERRAAGISPFAGGMGVLVHPRFDDQWEVANGVFTLSVDGTSRARQDVSHISLAVNTQTGAESVTNALSGVTPEVLLMTGASLTSPSWKLISASSVSEQSPPILPEEALRQLYSQAVSVGRAWLAQENEGLLPNKRRRSITLDFEFRYMASEWPALSKSQTAGSQRNARLIFKQVRSLEPGPPVLHADLASVPLPPELTSRAAKIERRTCETQSVHADVLLLWTRDQASPTFGYNESPFVAALELKAKANPPWEGTAALTFDHDQLTQTLVHSPNSPAWDAHLASPSAGGLGHVSSDGKSLSLYFEKGRTVRHPAKCRSQVLHDHPERLLREALERER